MTRKSIKKNSITSKVSSKKERKQTKTKVKKVTIHNASSIDDLGLNKVQAKTIGTMFTKEKMSPASISRVTGISRRKIMKTLEIQKLKTFSPGSYK